MTCDPNVDVWMAYRLLVSADGIRNGPIQAETATVAREEDGRICEMARTLEATIDDLHDVDGKAEIVGGALVLMSATGGLPNFAGGEIFARLRDYARATKAGHALTDNAGFVVDLPNRRSFSPDVAFTTELVLTGEFIKGAPCFAVEVRGEGEFGPAAERAMADKRADYFTAGTLSVWDVDVLDQQLVRSYRATDPETPIVYRREDVAAAEPALPGWSMPVDDLFPR